MIVDSVNEIRGGSTVPRGHIHIRDLGQGHVQLDVNCSVETIIAATISLASQMSDSAFEEFLGSWNVYANRRFRERQLSQADLIDENRRLRAENENLRFALDHMAKEK